jgi:hypothetical protein
MGPMRDRGIGHEITDPLDFVDEAVNSDFLYLEPCLVWTDSMIHCRHAVLVAGKVAKLKECR